MDTRVKDWSTDGREARDDLSFRDLRRAATWTVGAIVVVWLALFTMSRMFPYVENGADLVGDVKYQLAGRPSLLDAQASTRMLVFGNSQMLAGFNPSVFTAKANAEWSVFNMGLPGELRYVNLLETALKAGNVPTQILVQFLPNITENDSLWTLFTDNKKMLKIVFPFRDYFRDLLIFTFEAKGPLGFARQYASNAAQVASVMTSRGYYFIKSQSHYPNDELPSDYTFPTDLPNTVGHRAIDVQNPEFQRLIGLADKYGFSIVVVPIAYRTGTYAPPPASDAELTQAVAAYPQIRVAGPAYLLMEPRFFSDPLHLNPRGAELYTTTIASLVQALPAKVN